MDKYILMTNTEVLDKNINEDNIRERLEEHYNAEFDVRLAKYDINKLTEEELSDLTDKLMEEVLESLILVEDEDFKSKLTDKQIDDYEFGDMKDSDIIIIANSCDNVIGDFLRLTNDICEEEEDVF